MVLWSVAGLALLLALAALASARRVSRRFEALTQAYWELRYDYTRLRAQVSALDPSADRADAAPSGPPPAPESVTFVPLSTMRKKEK